MRKSMRTLAALLLTAGPVLTVAACGPEARTVTGPGEASYEHGMLGINNRTDTTTSTPSSTPGGDTGPELSGS